MCLINVRIKEGAKISQDFGFGEWPQCKPPMSEYVDEEYEYITKFPDAIFQAKWNGRYWDCKRDGYGHLKLRGDDGEYGNGSIFVFDQGGVEIVSG